jgi:hypothetical protein
MKGGGVAACVVRIIATVHIILSLPRGAQKRQNRPRETVLGNHRGQSQQSPVEAYRVTSPSGGVGSTLRMKLQETILFQAASRARGEYRESVAEFS